MISHASVARAHPRCALRWSDQPVRLRFRRRQWHSHAASRLDGIALIFVRSDRLCTVGCRSITAFSRHRPCHPIVVVTLVLFVIVVVAPSATADRHAAQQAAANAKAAHVDDARADV
jgi:hypothetical protein